MYHVYLCISKKQLSTVHHIHTYIGHPTTIAHIRHFCYVRRDLTRQGVCRWCRFRSASERFTELYRLDLMGIWCWLLVVPGWVRSPWTCKMLVRDICMYIYFITKYTLKVLVYEFHGFLNLGQKNLTQLLKWISSWIWQKYTQSCEYCRTSSIIVRIFQLPRRHRRCTSFPVGFVDDGSHGSQLHPAVFQYVEKSPRTLCPNII